MAGNERTDRQAHTHTNRQTQTTGLHLNLFNVITTSKTKQKHRKEASATHTVSRHLIQVNVAEGVISPADDLPLQHLAGRQLHQHITGFVAEVLLLCNKFKKERNRTLNDSKKNQKQR